ncbi:MAG: hypothetical protein NDJ75_10215 [Thermoanaerobaculia bacterium]|nr:hypothetical protein [Thermoanaerobaculia bacterium]
MRDCAEFESLIDREHAGEALAAGERERLLDHLESCRSCDELFDLLRELRAAPAADEPGDAEFAALRRGVRDRLARPATLPFRRPAAPRRWLPATLAAAAALGGLALGWGLATARATPAAGPALAADGAAALAAQLRRDAVERATFAATTDSPYLFSNVRVAAERDGRVRLVFDVARHLELELEREDPLLAAVLVQALLEPGSPGARLAAIAAAPRDLDPRVKQALLVALRGDDSLAVRLRAQQRLAKLAGDAEVAEAMLHVLAEDDAVELRFAAVDYLASDRIAPERITAAIRARDDAGDRALLVHAGDYLSRSDTDDSNDSDSKGPRS